MALPHGKPKGSGIVDLEYDWPHDEIIWAAGFYEGEGSVGPRGVILAQANLWPLEKLVSIFGGHIGTGRRDKRYPNSKLVYTWSMCGDKARKFIDAIYPYLSPRRQEQIQEKFITHEKFLIKRELERDLQRKRLELSSSKRSRSVTGKFTSLQTLYHVPPTE